MAKIIVTFFVLLNVSIAFSEVIEFEIAAGTGSNAWNTQETTVNVRVGDILRITNKDSEVHRLHTNGRPCSHGPDLLEGEIWDCEIQKTYDLESEGPLYDHYNDALFWLNATE